MNRSKTKQLLAVILSAGLGWLVLTGSAIAGNANAGLAHYNKHCVKCHGGNGQLRLANAANFDRREGLRQSNQKVFAHIKRSNTNCPSYAGILSDNQIIDVVAYLKRLGR